MSEYEQTAHVRAPADRVFDLVADVRNLPRYLPTTHEARPQGEDRVVVGGEAKGHRYEADGFLRADRTQRRLEWGSDEGYYSGWMQVRDGDGSGSSSEVTVHLSMREKPGDGRGRGPSDADVEEGLRAGLESIRNHVEEDRAGGKQEPRAAT